MNEYPLINFKSSNCGQNELESHLPLVSIITATFNSEKDLSTLIQSMRLQSYRNIEWIVVDGDSQDGTVELIKNNKDVIHHWMSEPDKGIYDAWNKGLKIASGELVCFLGSDDSWAHADSLENLALSWRLDRDIVSAKAVLISAKGVELRVFGDPWSKIKMEKRQIIAHPGMLFNCKLFKRYGLFDSSYLVAGDYEWLLRLGGEVRAVYLNEVTVRMGSAGVSSSKLRTTLLESRNAQIRHVKKSRFLIEFNFLIYSMRVFISKALSFFVVLGR